LNKRARKDFLVRKGKEKNRVCHSSALSRKWRPEDAKGIALNGENVLKTPQVLPVPANERENHGRKGGRRDFVSMQTTAKIKTEVQSLKATNLTGVLGRHDRGLSSRRKKGKGDDALGGPIELLSDKRAFPDHKVENRLCNQTDIGGKPEEGR